MSPFDSYFQLSHFFFLCIFCFYYLNFHLLVSFFHLPGLQVALQTWPYLGLWEGVGVFLCVCGRVGAWDYCHGNSQKQSSKERLGVCSHIFRPASAITAGEAGRSWMVNIHNWWVTTGLGQRTHELIKPYKTLQYMPHFTSTSAMNFSLIGILT